MGNISQSSWLKKMKDLKLEGDMLRYQGKWEGWNEKLVGVV